MEETMHKRLRITHNRLAFNRAGRATVKLTDAMIERRDGIARGLGFVLRRCSLGGDFDCWERPELSHEFKGVPCSPYHCVRASGGIYSWPDQAEIAALAIDKGKPLPTDAPDAVTPEQLATEAPR
jgi:hypothetical protein